MKYLLDANAVIALLNDRRSRLAAKVRHHPPNDIGISAIVIHELYFGAFKSGRLADNVNLIDGLYFEVLDFDKEDARQSGEVRATLKLKGTPIGPYDVLIAGQAISRNLILVTRNVTEFKRVPGLRLENWEA